MFQAKAPALEVGIKGPPVLLVSPSVLPIRLSLFSLFLLILLLLLRILLFRFVHLLCSFHIFVSFARLKRSPIVGDYLVKCVRNSLSLTICPTVLPPALSPTFHVKISLQLFHEGRSFREAVEESFSRP